MKHARPYLLLVCLLLVLLPPHAPAHSTPTAQASADPGLFGLNMYITGRERREREARELLHLAHQLGAAWTREEISWASWGNDPANSFYDERIGMIADAGFQIIGMLLTTPGSYRDPTCEAYADQTGQPAYWCAPTDLHAYAAWAATVVERYDADGFADAPGSPRIAAWEIWNEPDQDGTWLPQADPQRYGAMLRLAYDAITQADPTALVLNGGVMTFDSIGVNGFMDQAVQVAGWDSFDVLSLHPWLIDHAPDAPYLINPRERFDVTIPGRLALAQRWIDQRGGGKPIWITEIGWSTCGSACAAPFARSEDEQANYMVRTFILAAAAGVQHVSYFQLEDKFNGEQQPWGPAAILNDNLSPKAAYLAYRTLATELQNARYSGTGAFHQPGVLAHHRFGLDGLAGGGTVDVLWSLSGSIPLNFPLSGPYPVLVSRDGTRTPPGGGSAALTVSEQPLYVRQTASPVAAFAETPHDLRGPFLAYWQQNGGLERLGLPLSPQRSEVAADNRAYPTQWLERARLEYHPENPPPYDMLLGLLGIEVLERQGIDWQALPRIAPEAVPADCRYFAATRHSLCPPFLAYWEQNGGLPVFGFPISEPFTEWKDDQPLLVQYFERNRFEHHPDNAPPFDVLLGRLGAELMP